MPGKSWIFANTQNFWTKLSVTLSNNLFRPVHTKDNNFNDKYSFEKIVPASTITIMAQRNNVIGNTFTMFAKKWMIKKKH